MADAQDSTTTALAVAPLQGQVVQPWETMKPVSYEMAMMMPGEQFYARMEKVGEFTRFFQGAVRETILRYSDELRAAQNRYKRGEQFVPGCKTWQEAVPRRFGFSYSYMREVQRGGRKPRGKAKALPKPLAALLPQDAADTMNLIETLAGDFKAAFSKVEGLEESLRRFFAGMDDKLLTKVAEVTYSVIAEEKQKQEEKVREAIVARAKAEAAPKLTQGQQKTKEAMDRIAGILQGSPDVSFRYVELYPRLRPFSRQRVQRAVQKGLEEKRWHLGSPAAIISNEGWERSLPAPQERAEIDNSIRETMEKACGQPYHQLPQEAAATEP